MGVHWLDVSGIQGEPELQRSKGALREEVQQTPPGDRQVMYQRKPNPFQQSDRDKCC